MSLMSLIQPIQPITSFSASGVIPNDMGANLPIPGANSGAPGVGETSANGKSFGEMLTDSIAEINQAQNHAGDMAARFAAGEPMDVHQVMIASQEATVALQLALQVRNKLVEGYQELTKIAL